MLDKAVEALLWVGPVLKIYPIWAKALFVVTGGLIGLSVLVFGVRLPKALDGLDQSRRPRLSQEPYPGFEHDFPELVAPYEIVATGSLIHVVSGDLGKIRKTTVVLPLNQAFDFNQRGPASALAAFERHRVCDIAFYDYLEKVWPRDQRPNPAGIGRTKFIRLEGESHNLEGVLLVVSTRNRSDDHSDYGRYKNTPVEGIDLILEHVLREAIMRKLDSIAMPLIGSGYANIQRTRGDLELQSLLRQTVVLLSLDRMTKELARSDSPIRRGILVLYSFSPEAQPEDDLWKLVPTFLSASVTRREEIIKERLQEFAKREKETGAQPAQQDTPKLDR